MSPIRFVNLPILILLILLTACAERLTFNVNLGGSSEEESLDGQQTGVDVENTPEVCWPSAKSAIAEMRTHGYTPAAWPKTAEWLSGLELVQAAHADCS